MGHAGSRFVIIFPVCLLIFISRVEQTSGANCTQVMQCLGAFVAKYPQPSQNILLVVPDEIEYVCTSGKKNLECVEQGIDSCPDVKRVLEQDRIHAERYRSFVRDQCPNYDSVFKSKKGCVKTGLSETSYLECANNVFTKHPLQANNTVTCPLYVGILDCVDKAIAEKCGCPAREYFVKGVGLQYTLPSGCSDVPGCRSGGTTASHTTKSGHTTPKSAASALTINIFTFTAPLLLVLQISTKIFHL